jgi:hypothetical protein
MALRPFEVAVKRKQRLNDAELAADAFCVGWLLATGQPPGAELLRTYLRRKPNGGQKIR